MRAGFATASGAAGGELHLVAPEEVWQRRPGELVGVGDAHLAAIGRIAILREPELSVDRARFARIERADILQAATRAQLTTDARATESLAGGTAGAELRCPAGGALTGIADLAGIVRVGGAVLELNAVDHASL